MPRSIIPLDDDESFTFPTVILLGKNPLPLAVTQAAMPAAPYDYYLPENNASVHAVFAA